MEVNGWLLVIETLNIFSLTFAPLKLQSPLSSKLRPRTLNDFSPFYLKNFDCIISPFRNYKCLCFFHLRQSSRASKIFPGSEKQCTELHSSCRYDREPDPGRFPVLTAILKTHQKLPLKDLLSSAKQSGGNGHLVLERLAGAEA